MEFKKPGSSRSDWRGSGSGGGWGVDYADPQSLNKPFRYFLEDSWGVMTYFYQENGMHGLCITRITLASAIVGLKNGGREAS